MAPSSPPSTAPTRVSARKRAVKAQEIHQNQEEVDVKRRRTAASSSGKKPKPPPKQAKPAKAARKRKEEAERKEPVEDDVCAEEPDEEEMAMGEDEAEAEEQEAPPAAAAGSPGRKRVTQPMRRSAAAAGDHEPEFVGEPVPAAEARGNWPNRYDRSNAAKKPEEDDEIKARCHYRSAKVDNIVYSLGDDVYVKKGSLGAVVKLLLYDNGFKLWKQTPAEMQRKAMHNRPQCGSDPSLTCASRRSSNGAAPL